MRYGDISNRSAPIIAFNVDNLLFINEKEDSLFDKIKLFFGSNKKVDYVFLDIVNNIWTRYDLSVYMITYSDDTDSIHSLLDEHHVNYTDVMQYHGVDNLRRLVDNRFFLYVDNDESLLSKIGRKNAINISNLSLYLPVGGKL